MPAKIPIDIEELKRLYITENMTAQECAEYFGVSRVVIQRRLRANGIRKTPEARWDKIHETCLRRFGHINPFANKEVQSRIKDTVRSNYGVDNVSQSVTIMQKKQETAMSHYGVPWYTQTQEYHERARETALQKWGRNNHSQKDWSEETFLVMTNPQALKQIIEENPNISVKGLADMLGTHQSTMLHKLQSCFISYNHMDYMS